MKIAIFGTGFVGLVTGACLTESGNEVICVDVDEEKINCLQKGDCPISEKDLSARIRSGTSKGNLSFTTNAKQAIENSSIIFITVGTPPKKNGEADLVFVFEVAKTIGKHINGYKVVVQKSTVPVGTGDRIEKIIVNEIAKRKMEFDFDVVSNPEFLKEGDAVKDFERPDRVVIGAETERIRDIMKTVYGPFMRQGERFRFMSRRTAEFLKYACNSMLALRISFMNILSLLADELGVDIQDVRLAMGLDSRIGPKFLYPGLGFGGSCFPKDIMALIQMLKQNKVDPTLFQAVMDINYNQRLNFLTKIQKYCGFLGKKFMVWGIAFKAGTNDVRNAPSLDIIRIILEKGGKVFFYDPLAKNDFSKFFEQHQNLECSSDRYAQLLDADALLILTDDMEFRSIDFSKLKKLMRSPLIFDGRNLHDPQAMAKNGIEYHCIGRPYVTPK